MLKKLYKIAIIPFTIFLLYLMFFGMGRTQYEDHVIRVEPILSTLAFIKNTVRWWDIIRIVVGNVVMFMPFGFLGWVFPRLNDLKQNIPVFVSAIVMVEAVQYFSRLGICEIDDVILNTLGVFLGWQIKNFVELKFPQFITK